MVPLAHARSLSASARLRQDPQLAAVVLSASCTALGILPFAAYRALVGEWGHALLNLVIVAAMAANMVYAWKAASPARAGMLSSTINSCAAVIACEWYGASMLPWMYAVVMSNFFLAEARLAAATSILAVLVLNLVGAVFTDTLQQAAFTVTIGLVGLLAYIFARLTARQRQQLEALALADPLTGAFNRRALDVELDAAINAHARTQSWPGLLLMDLDYFKHVNDRYGHAAGDQVLVGFAQLVRAHTRSSDRLFRHGGEEFLLLVPDTHPDQLYQLAGKLLQTLRDAQLWPNLRLSMSVGLAMHEPGESADDWLRRVDHAAYAAKHAGRDRCQTAAPRSSTAMPPASVAG